MANPNEKFSELFIEKLGEHFGYEMAKYFSYGNGLIRSIDFTSKKGAHSKFNFEPIHSIVGDNVDYDFVVNELLKFNNGEDLVKEYLKIIFMDALVVNPDRHEFNFGLLRNVDNGEVVSLAPNFDNNIALISRGYMKMLKPNNPLISYFVEVVKDNPSLFNLPRLDRDVLVNICDSVKLENNSSSENLNYDYVIEFVMNNYKLISEGVKSL